MEKILYNSLAKKLGYVDFEQMLRNEDEIDEQVFILFNLICEMERLPIAFPDVSQKPSQL